MANGTSQVTDENEPSGARPTCFVIQPFDRAKFDKRYEDAFEPGLDEAGFDAYRVDQDPGTDVVISAIEEGIRGATICLADVTTDNPNVWYELGYAYAAGKLVILTCCDEREGPLPFDIQHRKVIFYQSESASDFDKLKRAIPERAKALLGRATEMQVADKDPIAPQDGLPQREIYLLGLAAGKAAGPNEGVHTRFLENEAKSGGVTAVAFGLALRGLIQRAFIKTERRSNLTYAFVTDEGWRWIEKHDHLFDLGWRFSSGDDLDDDIPF
ncbi:MAG: hypothetical protein OXI90_15460 [Gammaproteobacteria bacterium]|nr:hypothetical protein [Gammaproteobacteria bacterium]